jgi:hypothetical protein
VGRDREIDPHAVIVGAPIALVDCSNFYASCERVFQPRLRGKPVVALSNNQGQSPRRESFRKTGAVVRSSNYTLYGDMSARVMRVLSNFTPNLEIYSIDEVAGLAIPHGEFEPDGYTYRGRGLIHSRSLMGSSNASRHDAGRRRPELAIPHGEFEPAPDGPDGVSRSLMGEFERSKPYCRSGRRPSRDPSWGVRTRAEVVARRLQVVLAIPHGEFEPASVHSMPISQF